MTVTLICYACRVTCNAPIFIDYVDSLYLFGMVMKLESRYYVWDTSCTDCDR